MRVGQFLVYFPFSSKLKLFWERVTLSRVTTFYFVFSVLHAAIQVAFQAQAFSINAQAVAFLLNIVQQGNATPHGFMVYDKDLRLCESVPHSLSASSCEVVWDGTPANDTQYTMASGLNVVATAYKASPAPSRSSVSISSTSSPAVPSSVLRSLPSHTPVPPDSPPRTTVTRTTVTVTMLPPAASPPVLGTLSLPPPALDPTLLHDDRDGDDNQLNKRDGLGVIQTVQISGQTQVKIEGLGFVDNDVVLDRSCLFALNWPAFVLNNTKREDVVFIAFQLWVLGMSIVALLNESIPHVLASLLTHMLATGWSAFQISHTANFHTSFMRLTTEGACKPINLLPKYWKPRADAEIASLVANVVGLLVAAFLSWKLIKAFGWRTFKRIGASVTIHRQYTAVLVLSIAIQFSLYFILVAVSLWIDQLYNGAIACLVSGRVVSKVILVLVLLLLFPWLATGWFSVRRESKFPMLIFLTLSSLYLVGWGAMFGSITFRWTFVQWYFFGTMVCASVFLTAATLVCGGICRLGFGKGLPRYLNAQQPLPGDDFVATDPSDVEKVNFPSENAPIPTFSAVFGSSDQTPNQMSSAPRQMGPRFYNKPLEPFDPQPLSRAHIRSPSSVSRSSLARSGSTGSTISFDASSSSSHESYSTSNHADTRPPRPNRWVIE